MDCLYACFMLQWVTTSIGTLFGAWRICPLNSAVTHHRGFLSHQSQESLGLGIEAPRSSDYSAGQTS
jgi:hypothetical protein